MPEPPICQLPMSSVLVSICFKHLEQVEALQRHGTDIVITYITEQEDRR